MTADLRREWVKNRITKYFGLDSTQYFEDMMLNSDDLEDQLATFLDDAFLNQSDGHKRFFYVYKTSYEKLVDEEILVPEVVKKPSLPEIVEEPPAPKKKKGKKGKGGKQGHKGKGSKKSSKKSTPASSPTPDATEGGEQPASPEDGEGPPAEATAVEATDTPVEQSTTGGSPTEYTSSEATDAGGTTTDDETTKESGTEDGGTPKGKKGKGKKKDGSKKGGKKGKKKKKVEEPPPPPEDVVEEEEIVYVTKMVQKLVTDYILHGNFGIMREAIGLNEKHFVYMYRLSEEGIPLFEHPEVADAEMPSYFMVGSCGGNMLETLSRILHEVHQPIVTDYFEEPVLKRQSSLIVAGERKHSEVQRPSDFRRMSLNVQKQSKMSEVGVRTTSSGRVSSGSLVTGAKNRDDPIKYEIISELKSMQKAVAWTIQHIDDDIDLPLVSYPDVLHTDATDEELARNKKLISHLEDIVMGWERHILKVIESYLAKTPEEKGPIPEYEYWHERETALSSIVEQLKKPTIVRISDLLEKAKSPVIDGFIHYLIDLKTYYIQARDNVKFLYTILRYLKTITYSDDFEKVGECIPLLIDGLHLIWILSRYYCTDETMVPFMERIVWCLIEKVKRNLNNEVIFRNPVDFVQKQTSAAMKMLETWKESYMETRKQIEDSGKGARWEFDKKKLFAQSDYMATVCKDLNEVATVIHQFNNIFGAELRSIVIDPQNLDVVTKSVNKLVVQIENSDFGIFNVQYKENWEAVMGYFYKEVRKLEMQGVKFIDQSFKTLRHSVSALEMLLRLKSMETRQVILDRLLLKFDVILEQFLKEIMIVEDTFTRRRRVPPLVKDFSPHGGAIYWSRLLMDYIKKPVLQFQKIPELMESPLKDEVFAKYVSVSKSLKSFEESKFAQWLEQCGTVMEETMQMNVLKFTSTVPLKRKQITNKIHFSGMESTS